MALPIDTQGYWINHSGLNVRNLTASMDFYRNVLGLRHIFTIEYTPSFTMVYMGYSQGGRNGTGFQTGQELLRDKNQLAGLIKLYHFSNAKEEPIASTERSSTFANIGLVVPDIQAAQDRFDAHGVKVVKRLGEGGTPADGPIANAMNMGPDSTDDPSELDTLIEGLQTTDFENVLFIEDPDGNLIEILKQDGF